MNNELKSNLVNAASGLMHCTGSVATTVCDDNNGVVNSVTVVNVGGTDVVMVDPKAELAEVMALVATRKNFYNKALASLRRIYEIEKRDRDAVKLAKEDLKKTGYSRKDTMFATKQIDQLVAAETELAETMAMVMDRKRFFNRAAKSLQSIYAVENNLRAAMKIVKVGK